MKDSEGVQFLQWVLPKLRLRWPGFRKVRRQVYKRIDRRLKELSVSGVSEYRSYLESHPEEWPVLDARCWISISRFYRDKGVFRFLEDTVLPDLAQMAVSRGDGELLCWCIGCASGEEPYTVAILWKLELAPRFPSLGLRVLATDVDQQAIERARKGCYPAGSLKALPADWLDRTFIPSADGFCLGAEYRAPVTFQVQDVRKTAPEDCFHLILCRNLAFTYFDDELQRETLRRITERLSPGGTLVIGSGESLPAGAFSLEPWSQKLGVYRKPAIVALPAC